MQNKGIFQILIPENSSAPHVMNLIGKKKQWPTFYDLIHVEAQSSRNITWLLVDNKK